MTATLLGHLAVAVRRHREALRGNALTEPIGLKETEALLVALVRSAREQSPEASLSVTDRGVTDHDRNAREWLTRQDVHALTGTSLSTIDRWIASGRLRSTKHGRVRRITRGDLESFLNDAA